jgi:peptide/nickel transport system permease protein
VFRDNLGAFFGGVVIVEFFFGRAGIGRLLMQSILRSDYPIVLACVIVFIFGYVVIDFLVDIAQRVLNPRVMARYVRKARLAD